MMHGHTGARNNLQNEVRKLRAENERLRADAAACARSAGDHAIEAARLRDENERLTARVSALEAAVTERAQLAARRAQEIERLRVISELVARYQDPTGT